MTRKMILIASVASLALAAPVAAQKKDRDGDPAQQAQTEKGSDQKTQRAERPQRAERQQVQRAERPERAERQQVQRAERPERAERQQQRAERPQRAERQQQRAERPQRVERQQQRAERPQRVERQQQRAERPQRVERQQQRAERPQRFERQQQQRAERSQRVERQQQRAERPQRFERQQQRAERPQRVERQQQRAERPQRFERQAQRIERNAIERTQQRVDRRDMNREARRGDRQQQRFERRSAERLFAPRVENENVVRTARFDGRGYRPIAPVFSSRDMRQMTPFRTQFDDRQIVSIGDRFDSSRNWTSVPAVYGSRYFDNDDYYYRYDDDLGYAYQINRQSNLVSSLYPMFGGYGIGDPWPQTYYSSYVPAGYRDYYYDTPDYYYRNDGYGIYQVDGGTQLITALVSLVMGQSYGIGQALPASYGAYNVPLSYRANYQDSDDSWYRYGDGYIYQMDPTSRRIEERYPLYTDNYYVGQPWPVAYPDYNVPYGYQSAYQDTPQYQYRYANNGIYQVDPTNQVIMALAALISGDQFAVGQSMPTGYDMYNVPFDYRDRYADSDDEYFRYANGYVYQVDYDTGLIEEAYPIYT